MPNHAALLLKTQELDVLKIIEELGLDPERLFEFMEESGSEELEYFVRTSAV